MNMAKVKLDQFSEHGALLDRYGASIRVLGNRDLVRADVLEAIHRAEAITAKNKRWVYSKAGSSIATNPPFRAILNVCFPYTSRDEITNAVKSTVETYSKPIGTQTMPSKRPFSETHITQHIRQQMLRTVPEDASEQLSSRSTSPSSSKDTSNSAGSGHSWATSTAVNSSDKVDGHSTSPAFRDPETITAETLTDNMLTAGAPPLDLLIRTSGVERLSDFMLWQCHEKTSIVFLDCLWPEFDLWQFLPVLVEWQWQRRKLQEQEKSRSRHNTE